MWIKLYNLFHALCFVMKCFAFDVLPDMPTMHFLTMEAQT